MNLCELVGDTVGDVSACGSPGVCAEDDTFVKGNGHSAERESRLDRYFKEREQGRSKQRWLEDPTWRCLNWEDDC